jgi:PRTRC genetic system protein B
MANHSTVFEATGGGMALTSAILLYRTEPNHGTHSYGSAPRDAAAFASIHSVEQDAEGRPVIAAGAPLSRAHLRQWTEALGRTIVPEILPGNMLVAHPDILAWWVPAKVRPAYFALTPPNDDLEALSGRTIVPVPYPAHLLVATRSGLGVYALPANRRPTADTKILHSPILNVFIDGRLCWGNIPRPKTLAIASIPDFERALFDSWSTHPNPGQEFTVTGRDGLVRLWDDLATRRARRFPVSRLKPFNPVAGRQARRMSADPITVANILERAQ